MPLKYPPRRGAVVICDFDRGGFRPPEMVKMRPAVVLGDRLRNRDNLANVVPLSGTPPPFEGCDYQCKITLPQLLPAPFDGNLDWWAKADMITTVSYDRLDLPRSGRDQNGKRKYLTLRITADQLNQIKATVLVAIQHGR